MESDKWMCFLNQFSISSGSGWELYFNSDSNYLVWNLYSSKSAIYKTWNPNLNNWYHVVVTRNNLKFTEYVNGVSIGSTYTIGSFINTNYELRIGGYSMTNNYYVDGMMDEIRIYNRALNEDEIQTLFSLPG
jgi:hypothetical protein